MTSLNSIAPLSPARQAKYLDFALRKGARGAFDMYAAFAPFNEATRALHALFPTLVKQKPNKILVVWDRTGYLPHLLQSILPDADIHVTWEGDVDLLGTTGYGYWFEDPNSPTAWILDHKKPMAFDDSSFDLVVGLDVLHHVDWLEFMLEVKRILKPSGAAIFPHVHLANNQPDPFFERGGTYRLSSTYQEELDRLDSGHCGWVYAEPRLFEVSRKAPVRLSTLSEFEEYNGLVAWVPDHWLDEHGGLLVGKWEADRTNAGWAGHRGFLNPLVSFDLNRMTVKLDRDDHHGFVGYMFDRHPIYEQFLTTCGERQLSDLQACTLHMLAEGLTLEEIAKHTGTGVDSVIQSAEEMVEWGVLFITPISSRGHALQTFIGTNVIRLSDDEVTTTAFLQHRANLDQTGDLIRFSDLDEVPLSAGDCLELAEMMACRLLQDGLEPGQRVVIQLPPGSYLALLTWGTWLAGGVVVPLGVDQPAADSAFLDLHNPFWVCASEGQLEDWLEQWDEERRKLPRVSGPDECCILHTSGTTGRPKGVPLTHRQLVESAMDMVRHFDLTREFALLFHQGFEAMSGLRNNAVLPLICGGTLVAIPQSSQFVPGWLLEQARIGRANAVTGNPTFFRMLASSGHGHPNWTWTLCTGAPLTKEVKEEWKNLTGTPLLNYYGLTETTGFCTAESSEREGGIGFPSRGLVAIDLKTNYLKVFGSLIARAWIRKTHEAPIADENGWFWTGDRAEWLGNGCINMLGRDSRSYKTRKSVFVRLDDLESEVISIPDVVDAHSVVSQRDEGDEVQMYVVLARQAGLNIEGVRQELFNRLGADKTPKYWQEIGRIPRSAAGKVSADFDPHVS